MNKKIIIFVLMGIILMTIPLTLFITKRRQQTRSSANASTSLSFTPDSTISTPIQKNIGDSVSIDIMVNPASNLVTFVKFQIQYDQTKLALANSNAFVPNIDAFPNTIEGPLIRSNTLAASVSIGSDPAKAVLTATRIGTLNFKAVGATGGTPTQIKYTAITQVLSAGSRDQASENILSTTIPANIEINVPITITPTSTPSATTTPGPTLTSTTLKLDMLLHGVGSAGDNPNPDSSLSNKNPLHPQRNVDVIVIDSNNQIVKNTSGSIIYDADQGNFTGIIDLGPTVRTGNYNIKIKSDKYLRKLVPGIVDIKTSQENTISQTALVAGDVKTDNVLNVLDYNILLDCGYGVIDPLPLADPNAAYNTNNCKSHELFRINTDLDDNGIINSPDYNLFLRELSVQNGD
jgi:hypothetical protein